MLDIKFIREYKDIVKEGIQKKFSKIDIDEILAIDEKRLEILSRVESLRGEQNKGSISMGGTLTQEARGQLIEEMSLVKDELKEQEDALKEVIIKWQELMVKVPNIPSVDTPVGPDDSGNVVIRQWGEKPEFSFTPKEHDELGIALGIIDTETASQVASSRFCYLKGDLVRIQFALIQMCFEILSDVETLKKIAEDSNIPITITKPFIPIVPPVFVKPIIQVKMARFMTPDEHYIFPNDDLMLIGSAEHTLGPMHMDHTFKEDELPIRYAGYSTAFRREAGSYGKDTKGIIRQHQFDKLEMEVFSLPENSLQEQNFLVAIQEYILKKLKLPHQAVMVCTGDMGFPDNRQIDIETWMPGQGKYRETHSADLTTNFQSRRLNIRVKRSDSKTEFVHMNDATVVAIGRTLIAIMENYQQADGTIKIPEVLQKYLGKEIIS